MGEPGFLKEQTIRYLPGNSPFLSILFHPIPNLPPNFVLNLEITECDIGGAGGGESTLEIISLRDKRNPSTGIIIIVCVRERERERGRQVQADIAISR